MVIANALREPGNTWLETGLRSGKLSESDILYVVQICASALRLFWILENAIAFRTFAKSNW